MDKESYLGGEEGKGGEMTRPQPHLNPTRKPRLMIKADLGAALRRPSFVKAGTVVRKRTQSGNGEVQLEMVK